MILDNLLMFTGTSNGATGGVTGGANTDKPTAGSQVSSNIIDLHILGVPVLLANQGARDIGVGDKLKMLVQVTAAFVGGTSLQLALAGAPDNGSGAPGTFVPWWLSPAYTLAQLGNVGARLYDMDMPRPPFGVSIPRFLQMQYTSAGTFTGAGAIMATIVIDRSDQPYSLLNNAIMGGYPAGVNIQN